MKDNVNKALKFYNRFQRPKLNKNQRQDIIGPGAQMAKLYNISEALIS
jgi:hypothetical protein